MRRGDRGARVLPLYVRLCRFSGQLCRVRGLVRGHYRVRARAAECGGGAWRGDKREFRRRRGFFDRGVSGAPLLAGCVLDLDSAPASRRVDSGNVHSSDVEGVQRRGTGARSRKSLDGAARKKKRRSEVAKALEKTRERGQRPLARLPPFLQQYAHLAPRRVSLHARTHAHTPSPPPARQEAGEELAGEGQQTTPMASALAPGRAALPPSLHPAPSSDDAITAAAASAMGDLDITTAVVPLDGEREGGEGANPRARALVPNCTPQTSLLPYFPHTRRSSSSSSSPPPLPPFQASKPSWPP